MISVTINTPHNSSLSREYFCRDKNICGNITAFCRHGLALLRHICVYICGGISLTPHRAPPPPCVGVVEPKGRRDPAGPQPGKGRALGRRRPLGPGQLGPSNVGESSKSSHRHPVTKAACRSGYTARPRKRRIGHGEDGRDALPAQDASKRQKRLHSGLRYKRLEAGVFKLPRAESGARARGVAGQRTGDDSGRDRCVAAEAGAALRTPGGMKGRASGRSFAAGTSRLSQA